MFSHSEIIKLNKFKQIKGTQDILPADTPTWRELEKIIHFYMSLYNYQELRTPIFEQTELFARGIGEATDIVSKEMYTFKDRGKKYLTLKPEMTAPIIRAYIEHNFGSKSPLTKFYYIEPLFRQENPQAGRLRQFHQFGAEAIGSKSAELDCELILLALEIYNKLSVKNLKLKINSVGDPNCRDSYKKLLTSFIKPHLNKYCEDCRKRFSTNPLRILDCKNDSCQKLNINAPKAIDNLCNECATHFSNLKQNLSNNGINYEEDHNLVRGLDYYTRTVFEVTSENLGSQDAICGGGRYDLLAEQIGGSPTPAVGFASGIERLIMVMEKQGLLTKEKEYLEVFVCPLGDSASNFTVDLVQRLRHLGYKTDRDYLARSLKAQMREANRQNAKIVLLLGDQEIEKKEITIKMMEEGEQITLPFSDIEQYLKKYFKKV